MELRNGFWVDGHNNKWDADLYSEKEVLKCSTTLTGCRDCINCSYCIDCSRCNSCFNCAGCRDCSNCSSCRDCSYCDDYSFCNGCMGGDCNIQDSH